METYQIYQLTGILSLIVLVYGSIEFGRTKNLFLLIPIMTLMVAITALITEIS